MQRVGLFGGSFDPVHLGHLLVARAACEELALDRLYFVLAAQSPFKPTQLPAPAAERLRLLRLALAGQPQYEIDIQELGRPGVSYTIDTVRDYAARLPGVELFYLIGADHVPQLPKWREAEALANLVQFAVIPRADVLSPGVLPLAAREKPRAEVLLGWSERRSTGAGQDEARPSDDVAPFRLLALHGFPVAISSSQIRERVRAGLAIEPLVPPAVAEAIRNNRLYLSTEAEQR